MKGKWMYRSVCLAGMAWAASAWSSPPTAKFDADLAQSRSDQVPAVAIAADSIEAKLHDQLREAVSAQSRGASARESHLPSALLSGEEVLVEVHFRAQQNGDEALDLLRRHGGNPAHRLTDSLHEVWMPVARLAELASEADVDYITPARLARPLIGSKTSEGVAAGNANLWQGFNPSYTGTGIKIALIDAYDSANIASLQASNDWPPAARLTKNDYKTYPATPPDICATHGFGCRGARHGNATMEIAYDVAPGATYIAYDTYTVGDWRSAILNAANVNASGGTLGAVRANVISASLAAPLDGKGDGTALPGSIAEAAGFAKAKGVLVVNAAGNERQNHWGGQFGTPLTGGFLKWSTSSATQFNPFGPNTSTVYCYQPGAEIDVQMYWNDWTNPTHNYDLYLYQLNSTGTWVNVASSTALQNGGATQTPTEFIQFTTISGTSQNCAANTSAYAIAVVQVSGGTSTDNVQVFAAVTAGGALTYYVPDRSLDFPADSNNVLSVAAIDVKNATTNPQEPFSSQGPILGAGGAFPTVTNPLTDPNLKPDLASFDDVTTVSIPQPFTGTSASTPHVAGMAALFMQKFGIQTTAANLTSNIITPLRTIASTGANDLGPAGKDYAYGYGRLKFAQDAGFKFLQQPTNTIAGATITPAVKVEVIDSAGIADPYTLYTDATLAIGTNPSGGTLTGGGSQPLTAGIATFSGLKIDKAGIGYTLTAASTPTGLTGTSNAFNITVGTATHIAFLVQPSNVVAGHPIAPTVQVAIEDANNNVVTTATNAITLRKTTCNAVIPSGGGPIAAVNGIASFPALTLKTVGTGVILQASATGFTSINSNAFNVTAGDTLFANGFEAGCVP